MKENKIENTGNNYSPGASNEEDVGLIPSGELRFWYVVGRQK